MGNTSLRARHGAIALLLLVPACGGASEDDDHRPEPIPLEQLSARSADALCDNLEGCCAQAGYAFDAAACKKTMTDVVDGFLITPSQQAGATYDGQAAAECLDWIAASSKQCSFGSAPAVCDRIFVGPKAIGAACAQDEECVPGAYCSDAQLCAAKKQDGAACSDDEQCLGQCSDGVCAPGQDDFISPAFCSGG